MNIKTTLIASIAVVCCTSCQEFLDVKPNKGWVVPSKLEDFQAILDDNSDNMNKWRTPVFLEIGSDDYFLSENDWQSISTASHRNVHIWAPEIYEGNVSTSSVSSWSYPYGSVYRCNYVLEGIADLQVDARGSKDFGNTEGSALFYRAWSFFQLAQLFCKQYDEQTAAADLGIPLRLESDINTKSTRSSVSDTYQRIIKDLNDCVPLLPPTPMVTTRPSKWAAYALLAKVHLQMANYEDAYRYADSCLNIRNALIDYNELDLTRSQTFDPYNEEVIFHSVMVSSPALSDSRVNVDTLLLSSYEDEDLRKQAYFATTNGRTIFKGSYSGMFINPFGGIATDEVFLMRAECATRLGLIEPATQDLNTLMARRFRTGTWNLPAMENEIDLLQFILQERRKELLFRGIRWSDLRRLNLDARFAKPIARHMGGKEWVLPPQDNRYVLPIPDEVIALNGIPQNPR